MSAELLRRKNRQTRPPFFRKVRTHTSAVQNARYSRQVISASLVLALAQATALIRDANGPEAPRSSVALSVVLPESRPEIVVPLAHTAALLTVMRATEAFLWPDPFARTETFAAHYKEAVTKPPIFDSSRRAFEWDGDSWYVNTLGHGLFGSELYMMRARTCHLEWYGALAFAAAASAVWEYAFEGTGGRPSGLDLVYTPLAGAALGEARFLAWRASASVRSPVVRGVLRAVLDPLGEAERALGTSC